MRLEVPAGGASVSQLTTAVEQAGGAITALDVTASGHERLRIDVTCAARDTEHADQLVEAMRSVPGVVIGKVSDRTFLMHLGGKIEMKSKHPIRNRDDLSMIYTPGVARVCLAIAKNTEDARRLTIKRNSIAVVTDGSAVLGLGNIGPEAALPVMEGKAALFKRFAGIDAWPLCLDTQDVDEIVAVVKAVAPGFAGINLEDISAPRCFEVERRLREQLDIPVFHDDQHGTAIVVVAALYNALRVVGQEDRRRPDRDVGRRRGRHRDHQAAAGRGGQHIVVVADIDGVVHRGRDGLTGELAWLAENTNAARASPVRCKEAVVGADVFIGVSAPERADRRRHAAMAERSIVFALANPEPEVDPAEATRARGGRGNRPFGLPEPDQQRAGVSRGLPRAARCPFGAISRRAMLLAAARALAGVVTDDELNAAYIMPSVFHADVHHVGGSGRTPGSRGSSRIADRHGSCRFDRCSTPLPSTVRHVWMRGWYLAAAAALLAVVLQLWGLYRVTGPPQPAWFPYADKLDHAVGFALPVLLILLTVTLRGAGWQWPSPRTSALIVGVFAAHGVVSEVIQHLWYRHRTGDPFDVHGGLGGHRGRGPACSG